MWYRLAPWVISQAYVAATARALSSLEHVVRDIGEGLEALNRVKPYLTDVKSREGRTRMQEAYLRLARLLHGEVPTELSLAESCCERGQNGGNIASFTPCTVHIGHQRASPSFPCTLFGHTCKKALVMQCTAYVHYRKLPALHVFMCVIIYARESPQKCGRAFELSIRSRRR